MKHWARLLLCLLLSAGIWLIYNLSQTYSNIVSVPVVALSNIDGRARSSSNDDTITAQVKASGFKQLGLIFGRNTPKMVNFSPEDLKYEDANTYSIQPSLLNKYTSEIFGEKVVIESVISQSNHFVFAAISHKKVPVKVFKNIDFELQYMATSQMTCEPDSVIVYGDSTRLSYIEYIRTKPINLTGISTSLHGITKLDIPFGLKLSSDEVVYSMGVSRYVEIQKDIKLKARGIPANSELAILPSTAKLTIRCVFPPFANPLETAEIIINYEDFLHSRNGRCLAEVVGLPDGVIDYRMEPEVFDCLLKE